MIVSFGSCSVAVKTFYFAEYVVRHQTILLVNVVQEKRLETPFIGDNVKVLIKTSNCENLVLYFSEKVQKIATFTMLFLSSVTKQSLENGFGFPK